MTGFRGLILRGVSLTGNLNNGKTLEICLVISTSSRILATNSSKKGVLVLHHGRLAINSTLVSKAILSIGVNTRLLCRQQVEMAIVYFLSRLEMAGSFKNG
ncbi:Uncharacterized protein TCM_045183 [Theobroma cacao]|uniref:Uncharacterized protein n=1 Tax=Theobroma cacao TaxID=3641 RepID=A0A061FR87_THECC|nr:Uncharacterized protein TCM_045183 [Theobroma cacao]